MRAILLLGTGAVTGADEPCPCYFSPMRPVLLDVLFWIAVLGCAVAQFFIIRAVLKPNVGLPAESALRTPSETLPARRQSGRAQEIVWAVLPSLLLGAAFVLAWRVMHPPAASPALALLQ